MTHDSQDDAEDNPLVAELAKETLAPYQNLVSLGILSPELLAGFAETLDLFLTTHPVVAPVVERLRPREIPSTSIETDRSGAPVTEVQQPSGTEGQ